MPTQTKTAVSKVRILIADDHPTIRKMVRATLENHPPFEVCGEVPNGLEAVEEALRLNPDVIVLNIDMPVMGGFQAARNIRISSPESAIVILSTHADQYFIDEAKKSGACAYVAKSEAGSKLVKAIEAALNGDEFILMT